MKTTETHNAFVARHYTKTLAIFRRLHRDASDIRKVKRFMNRLHKLATIGNTLADHPADIKTTRPTAWKNGIPGTQRLLKRIQLKETT